MERRYHTKKGGTYIQRVEGRHEFWVKLEKNGEVRTLVGGIHIARKMLKELVREYPSTLLDRTFSFDADVEREFFEDARRERFRGDIAKEKTVIFFLVRRGHDKYGIGTSSVVERIEDIPQQP